MGRDKMLVFSKYVIYFIIYSIIGWLMEVCLTIAEDKKFVNRGFLIGPICPIYGWGVLLIVFLIDGNKADILGVFLKSIMICSVLEYFTSYAMEKLFNARWWDYSNRKYNINGRICLETMIPFGILGSAVVLYVHPFIVSTIDKLNNSFIIVLGIILFIIYLLDNLISFNVMNKIKGEIVKYSLDNTEEIRKKVFSFLSDSTYLFKHIMHAFPKFVIKNKKSGR